jgi:hypothetical protein
MEHISSISYVITYFFEVLLRMAVKYGYVESCIWGLITIQPKV